MLPVGAREADRLACSVGIRHSSSCSTRRRSRGTAERRSLSTDEDEASSSPLARSSSQRPSAGTTHEAWHWMRLGWRGIASMTTASASVMRSLSSPNGTTLSAYRHKSCTHVAASTVPKPPRPSTSKSTNNFRRLRFSMHVLLGCELLGCATMAAKRSTPTSLRKRGALARSGAPSWRACMAFAHRHSRYSRRRSEISSSGVVCESSSAGHLGRSTPRADAELMETLPRGAPATVEINEARPPCEATRRSVRSPVVLDMYLTLTGVSIRSLSEGPLGEC
mmetsp:Transcript_22133/g.50868  ORF Transcript_22133/g.50868 Transcript_22133/m.50868 type:complete len:279 (+) Transcript_22133:951-1787(+)